MKQSTLMTLLQKDYTTVSVAFRKDILDAEKNAGTPAAFNSSLTTRPKTPRLFTYKAPYSEAVKVDDYVVVEGPNGGPMVALVFVVDDTPKIDVDAEFEYKWIVQKIDRKPYEERLKREAEFLATMKAVEAEHQRQNLVEKFMAHLPEDSDARKRMEAAIAGLNGVQQIESHVKDRPVVRTAIANVWIDPSSGKFHYSDEAEQIVDTPYDTIEAAKKALDDYIEFGLGQK